MIHQLNGYFFEIVEKDGKWTYKYFDSDTWVESKETYNTSGQARLAVSEYISRRSSK